MVLSPEHPLVDELTTPEQRAAVAAYQDEARRKSDLERTDLAKEKTGVFTGATATNPVNGEAIPIWIADYVLASYGTGAIMAVPAHDERDFAFAKKFGLPIVQVVAPGGRQRRSIPNEAFTGDGVAVNSGPLDGLPTPEAKTNDHARARGARRRQGRGQLPAARLGVLAPALLGRADPARALPDATASSRCPRPSCPCACPRSSATSRPGTGESPLAAIDELGRTPPARSAAAPAKRETNTMPQWAGSCWYYLRYLDPKNDARAFDPAIEKQWMPVDLYVGGAEHAVLHLLYARFWHKVLYDMGARAHEGAVQEAAPPGDGAGRTRTRTRWAATTSSPRSSCAATRRS